MVQILRKKSVLWPLVASMAAIAVVATGTSIWLLYRTAYQQTLNNMARAADTLADLMESVAQFDIRFSARTHPKGAWGATMSQIEQGLPATAPGRVSEDMIIGRLEGGRIHIMRRSAATGKVEDIIVVGANSNLAVAMQRALKGQRGFGELPDYDGMMVLAGYAPVPSLGIGIVYKKELQEMRKPYISAALWSALVLVLAVSMGTVIFIRITRPFLLRAEESERRLGNLLKSVPVGVYETDTQGSCIFANEQWLQMTGLSLEQALGNGWSSALHPDDRPAIYHAWNEYVAGRAPFQLEYRFRRPDGSETWVYGQATAIKSDDGAVTGYSGTVTDITQQKINQLEVAISHERLNEAQRMAMVGSWELDLISNVLIWSDEIYRMFEVDKTRFGASYEAFLAAIHPDDRDKVNAAYTNSLVTRQPYEIVHRLKLHDGSVRWVNERCETFFNAEGKPLRSIGTVQDITDRVLAMETIERREQELQELNESLEARVCERTAALEDAKNDAERANRAKSEFLSRMSHELRTPMNAILGFSQVLEGEPLSAEQMEFVTEIHRAGDHLLVLINELLDLSRIEAGKLLTVVQPANVLEAARDALQITQSLISQKGITLANRCDSRATVLADPTRLKQILVNLLSNAAKYNRQGGRILVSCSRRSEDTIRIAVTDTGQGIAPENLQRLFRPFERLGAENSAIDGAGIGLALSKQLAELMNGRMGLDSTLGEGSTFWLDLPCVPGCCPTVKVPEARVVEGHGAAITVLYIEDNAANLKVVEAMFRHHVNLRLVSSTNGEYGLELAQRYHPDVILLDIHLPGMDGYAVLAALKADARTREIPVIALSADAMPIDIEKGLNAGFVQYLTKPVKVADLQAALMAAQR